MLQYTNSELQTPKTGPVLRAGLWLFALLTTVAVLVPLSPNGPTAGFDASWAYALNEALARGLVFGTDVAFTFGPYATLYTWAYHPGTNPILFGGSLYLALAYFACILKFTEHGQWRWVAVFYASLAALSPLSDQLFFLFPVLVALVTARFVLAPQDGARARAVSLALLAFLFSAFGLLALVKGTLVVLCSLVAFLCAGFCLVHKQKVLSLLCVLAPVVSALFFWRAAGQPLDALPQYFRVMGWISTGYNQTMFSLGDNKEIVLFLLAALGILWWIMRRAVVSGPHKVFLVLLYAVYFFIAFKLSFVRHDKHAVIGACTLIFAALILKFVCRGRQHAGVLTFAVLVGLYIGAHYSYFPVTFFPERYVAAWTGLQDALVHHDLRQERFAAGVEALRAESGFPLLQGTSDIYYDDQALLIASGNRWSPRPTLQSYVAYTPELAALNREHLLGPRAPENIFFKVQPIDLRIPSIEDGASWPVLLTEYTPRSFVGDYLLLQRRQNSAAAARLVTLGSESHSLGESVAVPKSANPVFVTIDLRPTLLGRLVNLLFKLGRLQFSADLEDGSRKEYRFYPLLAQSGFVLSPFIEDAQQFALLYAQGDALAAARVQRMKIYANGGWTWQWQSRYTVTFSEIRVPSR